MTYIQMKVALPGLKDFMDKRVSFEQTSLKSEIIGGVEVKSLPCEFLDDEGFKVGYVLYYDNSEGDEENVWICRTIFPKITSIEITTKDQTQSIIDSCKEHEYLVLECDQPKHWKIGFIVVKKETVHYWMIVKQ